MSESSLDSLLSLKSLQHTHDRPYSCPLIKHSAFAETKTQPGLVQSLGYVTHSLGGSRQRDASTRHPFPTLNPKADCCKDRVQYRPYIRMTDSCVRDVPTPERSMQAAQDACALGRPVAPKDSLLHFRQVALEGPQPALAILLNVPPGYTKSAVLHCEN